MLYEKFKILSACLQSTLFVTGLAFVTDAPPPAKELLAFSVAAQTYTLCRFPDQ